MLSLHTNSASLAAQNAISTTQKALSVSQTRLSTGLRINSAQDDAAGLQIATRLKAQTSGIAVAQRNTQNSISLMQTADGALSETTNILSRMKDLATQAADGSSTTTDRTAIQSEYDSLTSELSNIVANTAFGGTKLLNVGTGKFSTAGADANGGVTFQIGASTAESTTVKLGTQLTALDSSFSAAATEYNGSTGAASTGGTEMTGGSAGTFIDSLASAIDAVSTVRSALGAASNSLDHAYNNLSNIATNTIIATGRLEDTDFAAESANSVSNQLLLQAGTTMLKQSNSISSLVISLLQT
ncbi:flagellin [Rugamonas sp.]|uniref:flagellin N-terminal helical domain-containing protein n=1 Tax=Rugamonas sp. TaxID=1926287 RepID=UPI0025CD701B|nr:flagellin [Rugamonas sp.]